MGGVDVCDQQLEAYRTWIKTKKWTVKVTLHFIDLSIVNAWMEYRQDALNMGIQKKKYKKFNPKIKLILFCLGKTI